MIINISFHENNSVERPFYRTRIALRTARTITPTSAKTANPMFANPNVARRRTATLMPIANHAFSFAIKIVRRESLIASAIFDSLSSIKITSAASIAASLPKAPIAMPTSARASTGASLMPSPTKAIVSPSFLAVIKRVI